MAEKKSGQIIESIGPAGGNGSDVYRLYHEDKRKGYIDIVIGTKLTVGEDITEEEARILLGSTVWTFKEVNK